MHRGQSCERIVREVRELGVCEHECYGLSFVGLRACSSYTIHIMAFLRQWGRIDTYRQTVVKCEYPTD